LPPLPAPHLGDLFTCWTELGHQELSVQEESVTQLSTCSWLLWLSLPPSSPAWPGSSSQEQCWSLEPTVDHRTPGSPVLLPVSLSPSAWQYPASLRSLQPASSLPPQGTSQPSPLSVCSC
jgi:hypothetical protein